MSGRCDSPPEATTIDLLGRRVGGPAGLALAGVLLASACRSPRDAPVHETSAPGASVPGASAPAASVPAAPLALPSASAPAPRRKLTREDCTGVDLDLDDLLRLDEGHQARHGGPIVRGGPCAVDDPKSLPPPLPEAWLRLAISPEPLVVKGGETAEFSAILTNLTAAPLTVPLSGCRREPLALVRPFDAAGHEADVLPAAGGCALHTLCDRWSASIVLLPGGHARLRGSYRAQFTRLTIPTCTHEPAGNLAAGSYSLRLEVPLGTRRESPYFGKNPISTPLVVLSPG